MMTHHTCSSRASLSAHIFTTPHCSLLVDIGTQWTQNLISSFFSSCLILVRDYFKGLAWSKRKSHQINRFFTLRLISCLSIGFEYRCYSAAGAFSSLTVQPSLFLVHTHLFTHWVEVSGALVDTEQLLIIISRKGTEGDNRYFLRITVQRHCEQCFLFPFPSPFFCFLSLFKRMCMCVCAHVCACVDYVRTQMCVRVRPLCVERTRGLTTAVLVTSLFPAQHSITDSFHSLTQRYLLHKESSRIAILASNITNHPLFPLMTQNPAFTCNIFAYRTNGIIS